MDKRFAILIGINDYSTKPLDYCVNDVKGVQEILTGNCTFDSNNIRIITSDVKNSQKDIKQLFSKAISILLLQK